MFLFCYKAKENKNKKENYSLRNQVPKESTNKNFEWLGRGEENITRSRLEVASNLAKKVCARRKLYIELLNKSGILMESWSWLIHDVNAEESLYHMTSWMFNCLAKVRLWRIA
jgi:hypothetical protein